MAELNLELNTDRVIGIFAPQKYGKSVLTHYFLEVYLKHIPAFLYDTDKEYFKSYYDLHGLKTIMPKSKNLESEADFNKLLLSFRAKFSNTLLAVEDIDKIFQSARRTKINNETYKFASDSRHSRIAFVYNTKTPSYIPTTLRLNTNLFLFGRFVEPLAVHYITAIIPKEVYNQIKKPEFVLYDVWRNEYNIIQYNMNKNIIEVIK